MKLIWIFCLLFPLFVRAEIFWEDYKEDCSVSITLSSTQINFNEKLQLKIKLDCPASYFISTQDLIEQLLWHLNPIQPQWKLVEQKITTFNQNKQVIEFILEPLRLGLLSLSFFNVKFIPKQEDSSSVEIFTPIFEIKISSSTDIPLSSLKLDTAPLLPLAPRFPIDLTIANREKILGPQAVAQEAHLNQQILSERHFPWLYLLIVSLASLSWLLWKKISRYRELSKTQVVQISPQNKALDKLSILDKQNLPQQGLYKAFFTNLTDIIRDYIQDKFQLPVTSQTTDEFLKNVHASSFFPTESKNLLVEFLYQADQVKFANHEPSLEDCAQIYQMANKLIKHLT